MRTNRPDVYAIGDVTGQRLLAHVASHQGVVAAENVVGGTAVYHDDVVPACTFTHPEIASVGLTEADAREQHGEVIVGRFPVPGVGPIKGVWRHRRLREAGGRRRAWPAAGHARDRPRGASDIIAEGALALQLEATLHDLRETIHAHPTFPEATAEAAWAGDQSAAAPAAAARPCAGVLTWSSATGGGCEALASCAACPLNLTFSHQGDLCANPPSFRRRPESSPVESERRAACLASGGSETRPSRILQKFCTRGEGIPDPRQGAPAPIPSPSLSPSRGFVGASLVGARPARDSWAATRAAPAFERLG